MGDTTGSKGTETGTPKPSIDILKEAKPSENISITVNSSSEGAKEPGKEPSAEATATPKSGGNRIETVFKISTSTLQSEDFNGPKNLSDKKQPANSSEPFKGDESSLQSSIKRKERTSLTNKSEIFSAPNKNQPPTPIFSVGGAPSKTLPKINSNKNYAAEALSKSSPERSPEATEDALPSEPKQFRNPVTGIGVSSNDEYKSKPTKRRDGNPLLGVGYKDDESFFNTTQSNQRIPPGGYSQGLW